MGTLNGCMQDEAQLLRRLEAKTDTEGKRRLAGFEELRSALAGQLSSGTENVEALQRLLEAKLDNEARQSRAGLEELRAVLEAAHHGAEAEALKCGALSAELRATSAQIRVDLVEEAKLRREFQSEFSRELRQVHQSLDKDSRQVGALAEEIGKLRGQLTVLETDVGADKECLASLERKLPEDICRVSRDLQTCQTKMRELMAEGLAEQGRVAQDSVCQVSEQERDARETQLGVIEERFVTERARYDLLDTQLQELRGFHQRDIAASEKKFVEDMSAVKQRLDTHVDKDDLNRIILRHAHARMKTVVFRIVRDIDSMQQKVCFQCWCEARDDRRREKATAAAESAEAALDVRLRETQASLSTLHAWMATQ